MENLGRYVLVATVAVFALLAAGVVVYAHPWDGDATENQEDIWEDMAEMHNSMHNTSYSPEEFENAMGNGMMGSGMGNMHGRGNSRNGGMGCH